MALSGIGVVGSAGGGNASGGGSAVGTGDVGGEGPGLRRAQVNQQPDPSLAAQAAVPVAQRLPGRDRCAVEGQGDVVGGLGAVSVGVEQGDRWVRLSRRPDGPWG